MAIDNGSTYTRELAKASANIINRECARASLRLNAKTVLRQLSDWFEHCHEQDPHKALRYSSPRLFRRTTLQNTSGPIH